MNEGKQFEKDFKASVPSDCYYQRFNDNALGFQMQQSQQRFTTQSPYDCILYRFPYLYCLELKSTKGKSLSFDGQSPNIKKHQVKNLVEASQHKGIKAGFIFNFRSCDNKTIFVPVREFIKVARSNGKKSVNVNEFDEHNSIALHSELKKVHYKYDIENLLFEIENGD